MSITANFKGPGGKEFSVSVTEEMTVLELKEKCMQHVDIPVEAQRLIYKGKILKDKEKLSFYNVQDGHTLHLVKSGITPKEGETQKGGEGERPLSETDQATAVNVSAGNSARVELNQGPGDLGNANFADFINNFSSAMNNNPNNDTRDMFANMLNNPLARSLMNEISSNPEMISNLLSNTDILRGAMAENPYFNQFLQNPNLLRETLSPEMIRATLNSFDNGNGMNYGNMDMRLLGSRIEEILPRLADPNVRGTTNNSNVGTTSTSAGSTTGVEGNASGNQGLDNMNMSMNSLMQSPMFQSFLNNMRNNPNFGNMNLDPMNPNLGMNNPNVNTPTDTRPLEEIYASQLKSLQEMGFIDVAANLQALQETGGDINATVTRLLERGFN